MFMSSLPHQSTSSELLPKPALVVGSWQGDVGVVSAETGAVHWRRQTGRELGTLAQDGTRFYVPLSLPLSLHEERHRATTPAQQERVHRRAQEAEAQPSPLECRQLVDGRLLWMKDEWSLKGRLHVEVDGDTVLIASNRSARPPDVEQVQALDQTTGALRWSVLGNETPEGQVRLLAAGGGRTFLLNGTAPLPFLVVESQTGRELWSAAGSRVSLLSQPHSALMATVQHRRDQEAQFVVWHTEDGAEANRISFGGGLLHLFTDTGIAYVSSDDDSHPWVAALETLGAGSERWRTQGIRADTLALDSGRVYYACLHDDPHMPHHRDKIAEVGALDSETGVPLWSWRSPGDAAALLRLWGLRTPAMLVDAAKKSWRTVDSLLASPIAAPGHPASRWRALRSELKVGQWRRPYALHGANNALWLEARDGFVFVGTRLGLSALSGENGHLRWHAVPDIDVSFVAPALPPL